MHPHIRRALGEIGLAEDVPPTDAGTWRCFLERLDDALNRVGARLPTGGDPLPDAPPGNELGAVLTSAGDGIVALDREARLVYANPAATQILGVPDQGLASTLLDRTLPSGAGLPRRPARGVRRILVTGSRSATRTRKASSPTTATNRGPWDSCSHAVRSRTAA
ncbi:MAG: PAS domain-containing protein [Planctomycetes bacterium]|nr:PAS domain-containing protein [Planctomycetota bacterium]